LPVWFLLDLPTYRTQFWRQVHAAGCAVINTGCWFVRKTLYPHSTPLVGWFAHRVLVSTLSRRTMHRLRHKRRLSSCWGGRRSFLQVPTAPAAPDVLPLLLLPLYAEYFRAAHGAYRYQHLPHTTHHLPHRTRLPPPHPYPCHFPSHASRRRQNSVATGTVRGLTANIAKGMTTDAAWALPVPAARRTCRQVDKPRLCGNCFSHAN